ncbi:MAG: hypothetical protein HPY76_02570 [Anaerolineae bacterium]|nr:hypothetical protein [Anaerolineae bacterium]
MPKKTFVLLFLLMLAACTPSASPSIATPSRTPIIVTTPTAALTEAVPVAPPYPVPAGGFALTLPQSYFVNPVIPPMSAQWQDARSILLAAADYGAYGAFIRLGGGVLTPPLTADSMLDYLRQDRAAFGFELGESQPIRTESGLSGSAFTFTFPVKDAGGTGQVMLFASESQYVYLMTAAPDERWEALSPDLQGVVDSLTFIPVEPAAPALTELAYLPEGAAVPQSYHLGYTTLSLPENQAADLPAALATRPLELKGIFSLPEGDGPFPLALILHGRDKTICEPHFAQIASPSLGTWFCPPGTREVRYDLGFAALAAALAEQGIAAVSIDVNEGYLAPQEYSALYDNPAAPLDVSFVPQIAQQHLAALAEANNGGGQPFGVDLSGKLDFERVVLIGHSRGGQNVLALAQNLEGVAGVLMIAPANEMLFQVPPDLPFAVLTPSCDGDLSDWQSQAFFEHAVQDTARTQPGAAAMLGFANHNYFNGLLEMKDDGARKLNNEKCTQGRNILPQAQVQSFLVDYATAFARAVLTPNANEPFLPFDPSAPAVSERYGAAVLESQLLPPQQRAVVLGAQELQLPGVLQSRIRLESMNCALGEDCHPTLAAGEYVLPGKPAVTHLAWDAPNAALQFTFSPDPFDAGAYDRLSLRLAPDLTDARNRQTQTDVILRMRDAEGNLAEVTLRTPVPLHSLPSQSYGWSGVPLQLSSLRIPLSDFKDVELGAITSLTLVFPSESGALYLADVEFLMDTAAG